MSPFTAHPDGPLLVLCCGDALPLAFSSRFLPTQAFFSPKTKKTSYDLLSLLLIRGEKSLKQFPPIPPCVSKLPYYFQRIAVVLNDVHHLMSV